MRHRMRGRRLGRDVQHRRALFQNMACALIKTTAAKADEPGAAKVAGRIVTTLPKAKEIRPYVEKLITLAKKAIAHTEKAAPFGTQAQRRTAEYKKWQESDQWQKWSQAIAPAVAYRRQAMALLRDKDAVKILFEDLGPRFRDRAGGYTRVVRLAFRRVGDGGEKAMIEFVGGEKDRKKKSAAPVVEPAKGEAQG